MVLLRYFFSLLFLLASLSVLAAEGEEGTGDGMVSSPPEQKELTIELPEEDGATPEELGEKPSFFTRSLMWHEQQRDTMSAGVHVVGKTIDDWFAGESLDDLENNTYLRIRLRSTFLKAGTVDDDASVKMKIDLPRSKRRFKLFFETEPDENLTLSEKTLEVASKTPDSDEAVAGFRFVSREIRKWNISNDTGVRSRIPLDPFWRFKAKREWELNELWRAQFQQRLWYYHERRFGAETRVTFDRPITDTYRLVINTEAQYEDRYDNWEFAHILSTIHTLDERSSIAYRVGMTGVSQPSPKVMAYIVGANYRKRIHKDWLFLELRPDLVFPRGDNFKPNPVFTIQIDAYFQE